MYTLSIVEDEHLINEKIKKILLELRDKIIIVGQYQNGLDALNAYEQNGYPDIIISDICMPNLSGIELARKIRSISSQTQIIMISGYSDFEYAQQAIELNAAQYLLKPIKINELIFSVERCIHLIEDYRRNILLSENKQIYDLDRLLFSRSESSHLQISSKKLQSLKYAYYSLLTIHSCTDESSVYSGVTLDIENIVSEMKIMERVFPFYEAGGLKQCYVVIGGDDPDELNELLSKFSKMVLEKIKTKIKICCNTVTKEGIAKLKETNDLIFYRRFISDDVFFNNRVDQDEKELKSTIDNIHDSFSKISQNIGQMLEGDIIYALAEISKEVFSVGSLDKCGCGCVKIVFTEFMKNLYSLLVRYSIEKSEIINSYILSGQSLNDLDDNKQLNSFLINMIHSGIPESAEDTPDNNMIERAKKLIYDNFSNPDFSLSVAAEELYLNPSYLSRVFKETTGFNFSFFTNKVKIERAKQLLDSTNKDIVEISLEVGYNNQQYFSKIFKSFTGTTPHNYRRK